MPPDHDQPVASLVSGSANAHIGGMATTAKKTRTRKSAPAEKAFLYRGIKIPPPIGRRSPLAEAIRDDFRKLAEQSRREAEQS